MDATCEGAIGAMLDTFVDRHGGGRGELIDAELDRTRDLLRATSATDE